MRSLIIGSRGSHLALWQANHIAARLKQLNIETEIQIIKTTGDHLQTASLVQAGGKGLFTKEIEEALLGRSIDIAVHSLKDLPTENPEGLGLAAIPQREDPSDALVGARLSELPQRAHVGTSSNRRAAQLRILRPDLRISPVRGNVDTRLRKQREGQYDAIMLAAAGLKRLGLENEIAELFTPDQICPAPGQGALAIQTRLADPAFEMCSALAHQATAQEVGCERAVLAGLGGGCQLPIGAFAQVKEKHLRVIAGVFAPDGLRFLRANAEGEPNRWQEIGRTLAEELIERGAGAICEL